MKRIIPHLKFNKIRKLIPLLLPFLRVHYTSVILMFFFLAILWWGWLFYKNAWLSSIGKLAGEETRQVRVQEETLREVIDLLEVREKHFKALPTDTHPDPFE